MIKIQLNSNVVVRISATEATFYRKVTETMDIEVLTIPSHQISRINDLIKGLQNLAIQDCSLIAPKHAINDANKEYIQNH